MKKFAVVVAAIASVILFQGLTSPTDTILDHILADASLGMAIPLALVALAFWQVDEK